MTITTQDCKKAIKEWALDNEPYLAEVELKRLNKFKDSQGRWVRTFTDLEDGVDVVFVTETPDGLQVGFDPLDEQWYFQAMPFEDDYAVTGVEIVSKSFYDRHHFLDDSHISHRIAHMLPEGFDEDCESCFSTNLSLDEAKQKLLAAGFVEIKFSWNEEE